MKRKRKTVGPFVAVPQAVMNAKAWPVMSLGARLLNIQLRRRLRNDRMNNGHIFESCRSAAAKMGVHRNSVALYYAENEHYGFLRRTAEGYLGADGRGIAARYRFTDLAHGTHPPTRDYEKWNGELFPRPERKKQNPVLKNRTPRPEKQDIREAANGGTVCPEKQDIAKAPRCPEKQDISRLPFESAAQGQGSLTARAPAQAGGAGSSPAPVSHCWTTEPPPESDGRPRHWLTLASSGVLQ